MRGRFPRYSRVDDTSVMAESGLGHGGKEEDCREPRNESGRGSQEAEERKIEAESDQVGALTFFFPTESLGRKAG